MKRSSAAVIGLFLVIYILPLGQRALIVPDETRYAEIPREMLASGDWIVPHLNGMRYFEKPPLGYWQSAVAMSLFGDNRFAVRFPSAVSTGISALLIALLVWRFAGGCATAILAAAAFLTCVEVFSVGVYSILDPALSMFLTAAMVSFFVAYGEEDARRRNGFLALFGVFCGLAFLTKGFLAFAVPVAAVVPLIVWERRWRYLCRLPWLPILAALVVVLPWSIMIHLREPRFWHYFFWVEHVQRFASDNPQHPEPFWFYLPYLIGGALPWTVLAPAAISRMREPGVTTPLGRFAVCWLVCPFLLFSFSEGKIATYIVPCFPPLIILLTMGLRRYLDEERRLAFALGVWPLAAAAGIGAVILLVHQTTDLLGSRTYNQAETWKWVLGCVVLLVSSVSLVASTRSHDPGKKIAFFCVAPLLVMFGAHFVIPDQFGERKTPGAFLLSHSDRVAPETILVAEEDLAVAACWFFERTDVYLLGGKGEFAWGLSYDDAKHRLLTVDQFRRLVDEERGRTDVVLVAYRRYFEEYQDLLPVPAFVDTYGRFMFVKF